MITETERKTITFHDAFSCKINLVIFCRVILSSLQLKLCLFREILTWYTRPL